MSGRLTTHVLDTALGKPAAAMSFALFRCSPDGVPARQLIAKGETDGDGRSAAPLLADTAMEVGNYVLEFDIAAYHAATGQLPDAPFLGVVSLAFRISEPDRHLHVPLLVSPFGYTTYRGS